MGFSPQEIGRMSVWQFMAALDGYIAANTAEDEKSLSGKEKDELAEWLGI